MKKTLLTIGALASVAMPITMAVSCSDKSTSEKFPTFGQVYDPDVLQNLFQPQVNDYSKQPTAADRTSMDGAIATDADASSLRGLPQGINHSTVAAWKAFVAKATLKELWDITQYNPLKFQGVTLSVTTKANPNSITSTNTKKDMIAKIKAIIPNNATLRNRYLEVVNNSKTAEDAYYLFDFMGGTANPLILTLGPSVIASEAFNNPNNKDIIKGLKTEAEKQAAIFEHKSLDGALSIQAVAAGILSKFSGTDPDFIFAYKKYDTPTGLYHDRIIFDNKNKTFSYDSGFDQAATFFSVFQKPDKGREVANYILNQIGYTYKK